MSKKTDEIDFTFRCDLKIERITMLDKGQCRGNIQVVLNGLRLTLGIMQGKDGKGDWCAWPTRRSAGGKIYPIIWPANDSVRDIVEQRVLLAFRKKELEGLFPAVAMELPEDV